MLHKFSIFLQVRRTTHQKNYNKISIFAQGDRFYSTDDKTRLYMKLIFATNNSHKLKEVREILGERIEVVSLRERGIEGDIPETAPTLEGNALMKARHIYSLTGEDCFADDTGLEVDALRGEPGVRSARYATAEGHDDEANKRLLLKNMEGKENRKAQFRTAMALIQGGEEHLFEGIVRGEILHAEQGEGGFGYDPLFKPEGYDCSFAEMAPEQKNAISHRGRAIEKLVAFLREQR